MGKQEKGSLLNDFSHSHKKKAIANLKCNKQKLKFNHLGFSKNFFYKVEALLMPLANHRLNNASEVAWLEIPQYSLAINLSTQEILR